jgi:phytoene dehydrogenase-like protein
MGSKKVVVIGSGPGGSGVAALLAFAGHSVTLLEKNNFLGGKCSSLEDDGYIVDTGIHMFGRGLVGPFGQIASIVGERLDWCINNPMIDLHLSNLGVVHLAHSPFNSAGFPSMLKAVFKGWIKPKSFASKRTARRNNAEKERRLLGHLEHMKNVPYLSEYEDVSIKDFYTSISEDENFLRFIHSLAMITMVLPWDRASVADFLYIRASNLHANSFGYPKGGAVAIPATFLRGLKRHGGTIKTATEVAAIEVKDGRTTGVTTADGEFIPADIVISNAGIHRTLDMAGRGSFPGEYVQRADSLKLSDAFIATKYFLDRRITSMEAPTMFYVPDMDSSHMFDYLRQGGVPKDPYLFITVPGIADPHLMPLGKDLFMVGIPAPCDLTKVDQCNKLLDLAEDVAENKLFPEIKGAVIKKQRSIVTQVSMLTGRASGECIGLAQEVGQAGTKKPRCETPVHGLYLVGSDAGGRGIGTECAAESALHLYNILKQ